MTQVNVYLILRKGKEILLHLREHTGYHDGYYGLVAGHVEEGEAASQAVIREAKEEAGIDLRLKDLRAVHFLHRRTDRFNLDIFFDTEHWSGEIRNCEPHKCGGLLFATLETLPPNTIEYVKQTIQAVDRGQFYSEWGW